MIVQTSITLPDELVAELEQRAPRPEERSTLVAEVLRCFFITHRSADDELKIPDRHVVCIENSDYPTSLECHKIYKVVPDEDAAADGDIRVIDESGEDYLYSSGRFVPIHVPSAVRKSLEMAT